MITDKVGGLVTMFHRERLDSSKMAFIDRVQNRKQVSRFCLDHSRARNGREIRKQIKQTCKTKQRKEKRLKHKVSGYKSQSKQRPIAGCRLLLRTLYRRLQFFKCGKNNSDTLQCASCNTFLVLPNFDVISVWSFTDHTHGNMGSIC